MEKFVCRSFLTALIIIGSMRMASAGDKAANILLTPAGMAALKQYVYPLRTFEPDGLGDEDLAVLGDLIGDAPVVALGEASHGTSEFFKMKHRIVRYLAENKGFDIFSIEAGMPESYRMNDYTIASESTLNDVKKAMHFQVWRTEEVLAMVEWMRAYNAGEPRIRYTGFDMQYGREAATQLCAAFAGHTTLSPLLEQMKQSVWKTGEKRGLYTMSKAENKACLSTLDLARSEIAAADFEEEQRVWLIQCARLLEQYVQMSRKIFAPAHRDKGMAENVLWIKDQNPQSKLALWAHNGHITEHGNYLMGARLSKALGDDYATVGFAFYDGAYTMRGKPYPGEQAYPGTYEYILNAVGEPVFLLNVKQMKQDQNESLRPFLKKMKLRAAGEGPINSQFFKTRLADAFDYLIFIRTSSPSVLLQ